MVLEEWKDVVANSATICAIGMFLSGMEICAKFYKNKTTGETSPMTFLVGIVMTYVWFSYGRLVDDPTVIKVNGTGLVLQCFYTCVFYVYAINKTNMLKKIFLVLLINGVLYWYMTGEGENTTTNIGFLAAGLSVAYCSAPLASVSHVIRTKSADVLPFFLILMTVIVTLLMGTYGTIVNDPFIKVPNILGFIIAVVQLSLFFYYPVKKKSLTIHKSNVLTA